MLEEKIVNNTKSKILSAHVIQIYEVQKKLNVINN